MIVDISDIYKPFILETLDYSNTSSYAATISPNGRNINFSN